MPRLTPSASNLAPRCRKNSIARSRSPFVFSARVRYDPKRQVMGCEAVIAITDGKLDFGLWEQVFYGEFDRRRRKRVLIKNLGQ